MPVVLIDDNRDILEVLTLWLTKSGYAVHAFDNAPDALDALRGGLRPGLIVLDLHMPGVSGFDFRDAQLADQQLANIPVVVLTGHDLTEQDQARLGAVRFLAKPAHPDILLTIIKAHRIPTASPSI
jgi:two-component system chemotaxis response regulator CheY